MANMPKFDRELASKVLNLRRGGVPFSTIADQLNITPRTAKSLFEKALGAHEPEFHRALEAERLDRLHAAVWPKAIQGDTDAMDRVLRIQERRERVTIIPKENDHAYRKAFDASIAASGVEDVDRALVASGRTIADRVDEAIASGDGLQVTKALYLVPHMMNVLREMHATPAARHNAGIVVKRQGGKLADLRAIHGQRDTGS